MFGGDPVNTPQAGPTSILYVRKSLSGSVPDKVTKLSLVSSLTNISKGVAIGRLLSSSSYITICALKVSLFIPFLAVCLKADVCLIPYVPKIPKKVLSSTQTASALCPSVFHQRMKSESSTLVSKIPSRVTSGNSFKVFSNPRYLLS